MRPQGLDFAKNVLSGPSLESLFHFIRKIDPFSIYETLEDFSSILTIEESRHPGIFLSYGLALFLVFFFSRPKDGQIHIQK